MLILKKIRVIQNIIKITQKFLYLKIHKLVLKKFAIKNKKKK